MCCCENQVWEREKNRTQLFLIIFVAFVIGAYCNVLMLQYALQRIGENCILTFMANYTLYQEPENQINVHMVISTINIRNLNMGGQLSC